MVVLLPVIVSQKLSPLQPMTKLRALSFIGFLFGFAMETVADYQKLVFKSDPQNSDKWIQSGRAVSSKRASVEGCIV